MGLSMGEQDPLLAQHYQNCHDALPTTATIASDDPYHRVNSRVGYLFALVSAFGFMGSNLFLHIAETRFAVSPPATLLLRGLVHSTICLPIIGGTAGMRAHLRMRRPAAMWLLSASYLGALGIALLFVACALIPVADASAIFFVLPSMTMVSTFLLIGERVSPTEICGVLLSVVGAAIVSLPSDAAENALNFVPVRDRVLGSACAFSAALLLSIWISILRKLGTTVNSLVSTCSIAVACVVLGILFGGAANLVKVFQQGGKVVLIMVTSAICDFIAQWTNVKGLQLSRAGPTSAIRTVEVPMAYVLSIIFLHEVPSVVRGCGSLLILCTAVVIGLQKA